MAQINEVLYYELMEKRNRAVDSYHKALSENTPIRDMRVIELKGDEANAEFQSYCEYLLELLLEENTDVLRRLKNS